MKVETDCIRCSACTDVGPVKQTNEDSFFAALTPEYPALALCGVADGVSGSSHGEIASGYCAQELERAWNQLLRGAAPDEKAAVYAVTQALLRANELAWQTRMSENGRSSSTLSALLIFDTHYHIFHVGDSRIYQMKRGFGFSKLLQLTEDHSCIVQREQNGKLISKSVLARSIGSVRNVEYQYLTGSVKKRDVFLLCSDGLIKTGDGKSLKKEMNEAGKADNPAQSLVKNALDAGETDNITAIYLEIKP